VRFGRPLAAAATPVEVRRAFGAFGRPAEPSTPR